MQQLPTYLGYVQTSSGKPTLLFDNGFLVQSDKDPKRVGWYPYLNPERLEANLDKVNAKTIELDLNIPAQADLVLKTMRQLREKELAFTSDAHPVATNASSESGGSGGSAIFSRGHSSFGKEGSHASASRDDSSSQSEDSHASISRGHSGTESDSDSDSETSHPAPAKAMPVDPATCCVLLDLPDARFYSPCPVYTFPGPIIRAGTPGFDARFGEKYAIAAVGGFNGANMPLRAHIQPVGKGLVHFM